MGRIATKCDRFAVLDGHDPTACVRAIERARATDLPVGGRRCHWSRLPHAGRSRAYRLHHSRAGERLSLIVGQRDLSALNQMSLPGILTEVDTSIYDADPSKSAIVLVSLAKRFDTAA